MAFCTRCGMNLGPSAKYCTRCGAPVAVINAAAHEPTALPDLSYYVGQDVALPFLGRTITVPASMDTFNHYRNEFRKLARVQAALLRREYFNRVRNLDAFLLIFL